MILFKLCTWKLFNKRATGTVSRIARIREVRLCHVRMIINLSQTLSIGGRKPNTPGKRPEIPDIPVTAPLYKASILFSQGRKSPKSESGIPEADRYSISFVSARFYDLYFPLPRAY